MILAAYLDALFSSAGQRVYEGSRREPVTALAHALQCAQRAEWAQADAALVIAAFLHDVGHLLAASCPDDLDDAHERAGADFLEVHLGADVTEPIRLHVQAKRYLVATDPAYARTLTPASQHSLALQGGPLDAEGIARFETLRHAERAVALRRWDDAAKEPGKKTPPLAYYLDMLEALQQQPFHDSRIAIGSTTIA